MSLQNKNQLFVAGAVWNEFDEVIDVRTPAEYALDHIQGAINLPVLSNEERIEVGTLYKQVSKFSAKKLGAALISKRISEHLSEHFLSKPETLRVLVYCWRGGQRSQSLGLILQKIGFAAKVLQSGYKGYRRHVIETLANLPQRFSYNVICGLTGAGKTAHLANLRAQGEQVLDLEDLAKHRGSLLGAEPNGTGQPSQKHFDSQLADALLRFDLNKPIWIESEGEKIGSIQLPKSLWESMRNGTCLWLEKSRTERVEHILNDYTYFIDQPDHLREKLLCLKPIVGKQKTDEWLAYIAAQRWDALVYDLLASHYDGCYLRALKRNYQNLHIPASFAETASLTNTFLRQQNSPNLKI